MNEFQECQENCVKSSRGMISSRLLIMSRNDELCLGMEHVFTLICASPLFTKGSELFKSFKITDLKSFNAEFIY